MKVNIQLLLFLLLTLCFNITLKAQSNLTSQDELRLQVVDSLYSETLGEYRDYWVNLPENYNPKHKEMYPVVYLLDGFSLKQNLEVVYNNYWGHYLPHMILVGISNRENRTRDLTTSKVESRRGANFNYETGGAETFTQFLENELIPLIDKTYLTSSHRTLIGHSYAGLFTVNVLLNHSHLFNNYIAIDPSLDWDNQKLLKQARTKLKSQNCNGKGLFVALAAEQLHMWNEGVTIDNVMKDTTEFTLFPRSIVEFTNLVSLNTIDNGLNFNWKVYPEDLHGTVPLPAMQDGLVSVFNWFQFKNPQAYNNPDTSLEDLRSLLDNQEIIYNANFGYKVAPMVEELFVGYGQMYSQTGQEEKMKLFFNKAIQYYPNSPMAYESYAEYYESTGSNEQAIKYLSLLHKINNDKQLLKRIEELKKL